MAHQNPTNGHCLVIYSPHMGNESNGIVKYVIPHGLSCCTWCCFTANSAASYVTSSQKGVCQVHNSTIELLDFEQSLASNLLLPFSCQLEPNDDPTMELPYALYHSQWEFIDCIIARGCQVLVQVYTIRRYYNYKPVGNPCLYCSHQCWQNQHWGNMLAGLIESTLLDSSKAELSR